ncbi:MAG: S8 family serine peptidase [Akkermansiaceae bacterium]|nr:S8 family serine peptidase [Akkermansiaceae bacterium]
MKFRLGVALLLIVLLGLFWQTGRDGEAGADPGDKTAEIADSPISSQAGDDFDVSRKADLPRRDIDFDAPDAATSALVDPANGSSDLPRSAALPEDLAVVPETLREEIAVGRDIAAILDGADLTLPGERERVVAEIEALQEAQQQAVEKMAAERGIPLRIEGPGHRLATLHDFRGEHPLYRRNMNASAAISTGANLLLPSPYSLSGAGLRVGVWDGGSVRNTHQEFGSRVTKRNSTAANDDHATHVAGTIGASGVQANAKGMAPQILIDSYDWNSDFSEMTSAGAVSAGDTAKLPLSNHSYGFDATTADMGRYESEARSADAVVVALPYYLPFWAAGNEQDLLTAKGGFQSITFTGLAKNLVTVGATNDAVSSGSRNPSSATIASFSSLGPCDDGRIKPDVVANGVDVRSPVATSNTAYDATYSGTSMATPNALGSAALLVELYGREFSGQRMRASMLKGLLIHTATDRGNAGPDYTYGWGLVDVKSAADLILAHKASLTAPKLIEGTLTNAAKTVTHTFTWDGVSPIRATLCWTDPAGAAQSAADSRTPNLVHNLDLRLTSPDGSTAHLPFVMPFVGTWTTASMSQTAVTGKNNVDNVEQVLLSAPSQSGVYTATVSLDGNLTTANQVYSLVITGGAAVASNPPPTVSLTAPAGGTAVFPGNVVNLTASASDLALGGGPGSVSMVEFLVNGSVVGQDSTPPYGLSWTPTSAGLFSLTARATDGEGATAVSSALTVTVLSGDGSPVVTGVNPSSATAGATVVITGENFVGVTAVRFNGVDAVFSIVSPTQITAVVPAGAASGPLTVVNSYGTGSTAFVVVESPVLISQIYGAGGNTGSTYNRDYVELHNRSGAAVDVSGWSVQYASSSGTSWQVQALSGSIPPGGYFLVALGSGTSGQALPTPDVAGSIAMSATAGKVALMNLATPLTGSSPAATSGLQDFVGYGGANASEGAPAPAASTTAAIFRAGGGATDSGDNSVDFTTGTPAPRNSSGVTPVLPVINSPLTAAGTVGSAFSYQITASGAPSSFSATGLPGGLTIQSGSGLISGTPTTAGTTSVTLGATGAGGTGNATLVITIQPAAGGSQVLFSEDVRTVSATTAIASHTFQNSNLSFSGTGDVRTSTPSTGYSGASGGANVFVTNSIGRFFEISGVDTRGYSGLVLSFGQHKSTTAGNNELVVEVSADGTTYQALSYSRPTGSGTANWLKIEAAGEIPAVENLRIRFRQTSGVHQFRIDDFVLSGTASAGTPMIVADGSPVVADAVYGSPSPTFASFSLSGSDLNAGVVVSPPAGFEVSLDGSAWSASLTAGAAGDFGPIPVHVRLAGGIQAGSYSGDIVCTSSAAPTVTVAIDAATVRPKLLQITADDATKPYGTALTLGVVSSGYQVSGLLAGETIGTVTLSSEGAATNAEPGSYLLVPSAAAGGTFLLSNYDIDYVSGTLTVTGTGYAEWVDGYGNLSSSAMDADPDGDGIENLMEFFAGLHPGEAAAPPWQAELDGGDLVFTYRRAKGLSGVSSEVRWSADLAAGSWSDVGVVEETPVDRGDHWEITARVPQGGAARKFMRLEVSAP